MRSLLWRRTNAAFMMGTIILWGEGSKVWGVRWCGLEEDERDEDLAVMKRSFSGDYGEAERRVMYDTGERGFENEGRWWLRGRLRGW
ncbi:hypothetical protein SLA2020_459280 [Shorea laevis]